MALTDSVIHEIDTERWLLGEKITGTTVVRTRRSPLAAEHLLDPQLVLLETESGVVVEVEVGRSGPRSTAEETPCSWRSTHTCSARSRCPTFPGWGRTWATSTSSSRRGTSSYRPSCTGYRPRRHRRVPLGVRRDHDGVRVAWQDSARESSVFMREQIETYTEGWA
jgi:hypothetical protein